MTLVLNSNGGLIFNRWITDSIDIFYGDKVQTEDFIKQYIEQDTLLLLEGGADIDPSIYKEPNIYSRFWSRQRDHNERLVLDLALKYNIPILGICRGHQLAAAHLGGTLWQDIEKQCGVYHHEEHPITVYDKLLDHFGGGSLVNSLHHQAVRDFPKDAIAQAEHEGINEALYYPELKIFTVQWHPELMHDKLFFDWVTALLNVAKGQHNEAAWN